MGNKAPLEKNKGRLTKFIINPKDSNVFSLEAIIILILTKPIVVKSIIGKQANIITGCTGMKNTDNTKTIEA